MVMIVFCEDILKYVGKWDLLTSIVFFFSIMEINGVCQLLGHPYSSKYFLCVQQKK